MNSENTDPIFHPKWLHGNSASGIFSPQGISLFLSELCGWVALSAKNCSKNMHGMLCIFFRRNPLKIFCSIVVLYAILVIHEILEWWSVAKSMGNQSVDFAIYNLSVSMKRRHGVAVLVWSWIQDAGLTLSVVEAPYASKITDFIRKISDWRPCLAGNLKIFTHA
jgi:hypothetical protein